MTPVELHCLDPERNKRRVYRPDVQPDLFGGFLLVRQCGRIGTGGQLRFEFFTNKEQAALVELERIHRLKARRGYRSRPAPLLANCDRRLR